jgi:predicted house-cleaning NTP pyrophosphatase (Maf/HAM1 superfamily)
LANVFESDEKRKKIQKEIERAQRLLSDSIQSDDREVGSQPDGELNEGEQLEKVGSNKVKFLFGAALMKIYILL